MKADFFTGNRRALTKKIQGGVVVIAAYDQMQRSNDMAFAFEQEANFRYLTGIDAPRWRLIIDTSTNREWLVMPYVDDVHQVFDGSLSADEASKVSGVRTVISHSDEDGLLDELSRKHTVAYTLGRHPHASHFDFVENPAAKELRDQLERQFESVQDCRKQLAELRAIKHSDEITALQRAIDVSIEGFEAVRQALSSVKYEYELEAIFNYHFTKKGGACHAYDPIIASGANACTLHYIKNNARVLAKNMVLLDVGASVDGYAADITRTYAKGEVSTRKQSIHEAVVSAQQQIIALLKPGLSVQAYADQSDAIMKEALSSVGLLKEISDDETFRRYFPHAVSHGLGIDVHDSLGAPVYFEPGMVLTVEPGIYIPEEGIGVRIEDDILITNTGHKNLSAALSTDLS